MSQEMTDDIAQDLPASQSSLGVHQASALLSLSQSYILGSAICKIPLYLLLFRELRLFWLGFSETKSSKLITT